MHYLTLVSTRVCLHVCTVCCSPFGHAAPSREGHFLFFFAFVSRLTVRGVSHQMIYWAFKVISGVSLVLSVHRRRCSIRSDFLSRSLAPSTRRDIKTQNDKQVSITTTFVFNQSVNTVWHYHFHTIERSLFSRLCTQLDQKIYH